MKNEAIISAFLTFPIYDTLVVCDLYMSRAQHPLHPFGKGVVA